MHDTGTSAYYRVLQLCDALEEALEGWTDACAYKGEYLCQKHGDTDVIARLRFVLHAMQLLNTTGHQEIPPLQQD